MRIANGTLAPGSPESRFSAIERALNRRCRSGATPSPSGE